MTGSEKRKRSPWLLWLAILLAVQSVLVPKYGTSVREGALTGEYYRFYGDNDVIFIGDCEVYENFSTITLWEEYGIPSCIRGSPQQTLWQSCCLLEETLRYETPRVVIFNVLAMKYDTPESTGDPVRREAYNRITLDTMRWSASKWKAIQASMTEAERKELGVLGYLFPILRYHDRWSELSREDILPRDRQLHSHNGYLMNTGIRPYEGFLPEPPPGNYAFGENCWYYLNQMEKLCREAGVQLVLIKAPSLYPYWWSQWDRQMEDYAREKGLLYISMTDCEQQMGIDWNTDTHDGGLHLNVYGAEKAARWLGAILQEQCDLPDRRGEPELAAAWEKKTEAYYRQREE